MDIFRRPRCYDPLTAMAAVMAVGGSIYSGIQADKQGKEQQKLYEEQARIQQEETATTMKQTSDARRRLMAEQRMAYLANGVELTGTPLVVGDETFKEYQTEIDAIQKSGAAKSSLLQKQGKMAAASGRTQLISSLFTAGETAAKSKLFK